MDDLQSYVGKHVKITDDSGKQWFGIVDSYDPDDSFGNYDGESIDVRVNGDKNQLVCFAKPQIIAIDVA